MENEFNPDFDNSSDIKSLEDFFSKDISTFLTPQEMMVMSLSLSHVAQVLELYNRFTNVAVFDATKFIKEHPEYANIDFNHLSEDETLVIKDLLKGKNNDEYEEFNKGDILLNSIINNATTIGHKLCDSYVKEYNKTAPMDTVQFFTMLENCLGSSLNLLQSFFTQERR